jgi:hypothetical protein
MANTKSLDLKSSSSQYGAITDAAQTGLAITGAMTIECWVNFESLPSGAIRAFVAKNDSSDDNQSYLFGYREDGGPTGLHVRLSSGGGDGTAQSGLWSWTPDLDTWYHVAMVYDPSQGTAANRVRCYINGSDQGTVVTSWPNSIFDSNADFRVGASDTGLYFDGKIDDVRVWNDVRTADEIVDNMLSELNGDEANLVGYWKFNDNALDETSNNNDLTLSGSPVYSANIVPLYSYTPYFKDNFNRTDSATVGGSWTETDADSLLSIYSNALRINAGVDKPALIYTDSGFQSNNIKITFTINPVARANNSVTTIGTLAANSNYSTSYGVALGIRSTGKIWWNDNGAFTDETNFTWTEGTTYNVEVLIFPDYSGEVRVWDSASARPSSSTLTHAAETPTASGTYYKIGHDNGAAASNDFRIDNLLIRKISLVDDLISYYRFDESSGNASDSVGGNTLTNNGATAYATGKINNGADIEYNNNNYFSITHASQSGLNITGDLSISCWVKPESFTENAVLVAKGGASVNNGYNLILLTSGKIASDIFEANGSDDSYVRTSDVLSTGTWYYITMTYTASTGKILIYINGSLANLEVDTQNATSIYANTDPFTIGSGSTGSNSYDGIIDEVGVWNRILTSTEITALYNGGYGIQYPFSATITFTPRIIII